MQILFTDHGDAESVARRMEMSGERAVNTAIPMTEIATDMMRVEREIFASGGRRGGGSWAQLKESTIKRKGGSQILRDTDALYLSLTVPGAPHQILNIGNSSVEFGTERPWAIVHVTGSRRGVPARPFMRFTRHDRRRWEGLILKHIMEPFTA